MAADGPTYEGWLECLARCAVGLYGPLELLKLHQLLDCICRNCLQGETIEQAANSLRLYTRDSLAGGIVKNEKEGAAADAKAADAKAKAAEAAKEKEGGDAKGKGKKGAKGAKEGAAKDAKGKEVE